MLRSSLGFHTIMLARVSLNTETLLQELTEYSHKTGTIKIYPDKIGNTVVKFYKEYKGIEWMVRHNIWLNDISMFVDYIYITINPKILGGVTDYITAATIDDMAAAITNFNSISQEISTLLPTFEQCSITRVDYCVNFSLKELIGEYDPEQMMNLIKRSDIPPSYHEWMEYDEISHRKRTRPGSFYLINDSVHINCYSKYMQLLDKSKKNIERGYPPVPQKTLDDARDIIRFEVQCHYRKTYFLSRNIKQQGRGYPNKYKEILAQEQCIEIINSYYKKTIGWSNWYSLEAAVALVKSRRFNSQKEKRLISALQEVSQCRSLAKAKVSNQGSDLESFKRSLNDLSSIGINPVTIPKNWGVKRIWNLLETYYSKLSQEDLNIENSDVFSFK